MKQTVYTWKNFVEYGHTYLEVTRHLKEKISDKWRRHPLTDRWDAELVKWQHQHPSRNIPKKTFSSFVGIIWTKSNRTLSSSAPERLPRWKSRTKVLPSTHPCCLFTFFLLNKACVFSAVLHLNRTLPKHAKRIITK
jgi:hypothetical protein